MDRLDLLLQQRVLELLCVELDPQLVGAHPGGGEEHGVFDEVRGGRSSAGVGVDHELQEEERKKR